MAIAIAEMNRSLRYNVAQDDDRYGENMSVKHLAGEAYYLAPLTSIRFFAALTVVLYHFGRKPLAELGAPVWMLRFLDYGYIGVPMFFILSGFILTHVYLRPSSPSFNVRRFWMARFGRVYPLFALSLIIPAPLFLEEAFRVMPPDQAVRYFGKLLLLYLSTVHIWFIDVSWPVWNIPAWSLSIEAWFYVLFPVIAWASRRSRVRWFAVGVLLVWAATLLVPVSVGALCLAVIVSLPQFLVGVLLGQMFQRGILRSQAKPLMLLGVMLLVALVSFASPDAVSTEQTFRFEPITTLFVVPLALVIYGLSLDRGRIATWLSWPALVLLGEASYALYILQAPLYAWMMRAALLAGVDRDVLGTSPWFLGAFLIVALAISVLSYQYFETPLRRKIRVSLIGSRSGVWHLTPSAQGVATE